MLGKLSPLDCEDIQDADFALPAPSIESRECLAQSVSTSWAKLQRQL